MTKTRLSILILAVVTALILAGCGTTEDSVSESSVEPGLQTFGVAVNPSAQPSTGQVMPEVSASNPGTVTSSGGSVSTDDQGVSNTASPSTQPDPTQKPSGNGSGSGSGSGTTTPSTPTTSPVVSTSPNIAPPAPVSSATVDDVMKYVGKTFQELVEDLGYPNSSSYEYVDDADPSQGEIGTIYYTDFIVTTRRSDGVETITDVTPLSSQHTIDGE